MSEPKDDDTRDEAGRGSPAGSREAGIAVEEAGDEIPLGTVLATLRIAAGLAPADVAQACDLRVMSIFDYELGRRPPALKVIQKILEAEGFPLTVLDRARDLIAELQAARDPDRQAQSTTARTKARPELLSPSEWKVFWVLSKRHPLTSAQVVQELSWLGSDLSLDEETVGTFLKRLQSKGYLTTAPAAWRGEFLYDLAVSYEVALRLHVHRFLDQFAPGGTADLEIVRQVIEECLGVLTAADGE